MKILDEDLLLKYDVHIEKKFNTDGTILYDLKGNQNEVEEILDILINRSVHDYQINRIKSRNKNNINYNILFMNKPELKQDITELTDNNNLCDIN
jgi:hypothetical protein